MNGYWHSFVGGEMTAEFFGQFFDAKYQTGLAKCRNFRILPHGPAQNRAGFEFVREVKDSARRVRLMPFTYSTTQTMVIEAGHQYFRYHTQGATILSGAVPYETVTGYQEADLFSIGYTQSADVFTLVHVNNPPAELRRTAPGGVFTMTLANIVFATTLAPPGGVTATATPAPTPGTPITHEYAVTSVSSNNIDESLISASATCSNNLFDTGAFNTIGWTLVSGALRYNVYKKSNGLWGYLGQASGASFTDDNITPDISKTPPENNNPFAAPGDYPGAVAYFDQRRCFGGTLNKPQNLWMTRSGTESNMSYSIPAQDADSIAFRVVAREANTVRHLVPMASLLALTSAAEWRVTSVNTDALTSTSISVKPQSSDGANDAQPVLVSTSVVYAAARGGHVREMAYNWQAGGYITGDLSLRAPHLFNGFDIVDIAYSKAPYPIVWMVSSNGRLLGITYVPEQQVGAWHWHDTDGLFESVCCVAEGQEDVLYAVVRRQINGQWRRYIERMRPRVASPVEDCFFVDCGLTYSGAPASIISGLGHIEGKTVNVLADGGEHRPLVVSGGQIKLDRPASKVHVGLPIVADLQALPLALQIPGMGNGRAKNINKVWLRVTESLGIFAGPDFGTLTPAQLRTDELPGEITRLQTGLVEIATMGAWEYDSQPCVRQTAPLPLTVSALGLDVA